MIIDVNSQMVNFHQAPEFIYNNHLTGQKVLSVIEDELKRCQSFTISVAFITMGGLTPLLQTLKELEQRGVPGRVLTTDYLGFNDPKVLEKLASLKNIELRVYCSAKSSYGFHTKGYIFQNEADYKIIIGSSNLTAGALTINKEWNTKVQSLEDDNYTQKILKEFEAQWTSPYTLSYEEFIPWYRTEWVKQEVQKTRITLPQVAEPTYQSILRPNAMQSVFIENLRALRAKGERRGLLISATGTGKTYASAFALKDMKPKRILFVVHREQIAKQARESYRRVFNQPSDNFGLLSGSHKDLTKPYLFGTIQTLQKDDILNQFKPDDFDVIVIDEVHRAGASSYQKIVNYFQPQFLLGMTASPERTDGFDIFQMFDHNIAYEIRLQKALEENLLCPFHYFGITDLNINDESIDISKQGDAFNRINFSKRIDYILEQAEYYGYSGDRVKGLVFCSTKEDAQKLSQAFNAKGYRTAALTGSDSQEVREATIQRLVSDVPSDPNQQLDYIFSVDIFNEGIDIPEVNQIIMLRPTESPIVFVQQLGRGLRKHKEKEYVVILDFIGNYNTNFMIPIALSGDRSYNKDNLRRYIQEGNRIIPGTSTIHFDSIAKQRIFASIDSAKLGDARLLKESYKQLKYKLGRIPSLLDFDTYDSIDPLKIFANKTYGSYYTFLKKVEGINFAEALNERQINMLEYISQKLASGMRPHELILLQLILDGHSDNLIAKTCDILQKDYHIQLSDVGKENLINMLTNQFGVKQAMKTFKDAIFIESADSDYTVSPNFANELESQDFKQGVLEAIKFGLHRYNRDYNQPYKNTGLRLYAKYTYEDVCRLLEWKQNEVPLNIGGYKFDKHTKTYPVFINYHKSDQIQDTIKYEDRFINQSRIKAISKNKRSLDSEDVKTALHAQELGVRMELFVRKNKDDNESKEFYYLGPIYATGQTESILMADGKSTAVELEYQLEVPVRDDIYDYIVNG